MKCLDCPLKYTGQDHLILDIENTIMPPASAEVKKMWIYTSTPPICLHGVVLNSLSTGTTLPFTGNLQIVGRGPW
jgi:hypothetical protein